MHRNGYLWTSGVNLDNAVQFPDPDFLVDCKILAIWWRFPLIFFAFYMLNVRHISTSGLFDQLTLKVYHTRRPHVDNSHQVWSWYDHTLPSYSVFVCWYVTWPCDLDLWPFDIEQLSYMAGHVINPATKFKEPATKRSWVTSYNGSNWLPLKMRTLPQRMLQITWPVSRGQKQLHFWNTLPRFVYSLCNFGGSMMKIIKVICENNARPALKNVWVSAHARNHVIC